MFLKYIYSSDDLIKSENTSSLEKFYDAFHHFLEVDVLLSECCSRSTNIDNLDVLVYKTFDDIDEFKIASKCVDNKKKAR